MQIAVQCHPDADPPLDDAPKDVLVRPGRLGSDDLQQLRRILHTLVTTAPRTVTVDVASVDGDRRANVLGVLVGAAREARVTGSVVRVHQPSAEQRRSFATAGIEEQTELDEPGYVVLVGDISAPMRAAI